MRGDLVLERVPGPDEGPRWFAHVPPAPAPGAAPAPASGR